MVGTWSNLASYQGKRLVFGCTISLNLSLPLKGKVRNCHQCCQSPSHRLNQVDGSKSQFVLNLYQQRLYTGCWLLEIPISTQNGTDVVLQQQYSCLEHC